MNCPICNEVMMQMVTMYLWCPTTEQIFDKKALRKKTIEISGVSRPEPEKYICLKHGSFEGILKRMEEDDKQG